MGLGKYGKCPIIFIDEEKQKEWDEMPESVKNAARSHLFNTMKSLTQDAQIELLCHLYNDLSKRLENVEKRP